MSSSPPPEAPHFRGKTLTPESPVPVHVPEPQNIPVLQKQTDEIFNLVSTHMTQPSEPRSPQNVLYHPHQPYDSLLVRSASDIAGPEMSKISEGSQEGVESDLQDNGGHGYAIADVGKAWGHHQEPDTSENSLLSSLHPSTSAGVCESLSTHDENKITPLFPNPSQDPTEITQVSPNSPKYSQIASVGRDPETIVAGISGKSSSQSQNQDANVNGEGVNYQSLLDHLSPSLYTASGEGDTSSFTTSVPSGTQNISNPSSTQTPIATLPIPVGLPPRPPPQEKPAIHPNYTPGEDIRTYHNPPAQNPNPQPHYNSQQANSHRLLQGFLHNNDVGPNGLPPPPLATFQQPLSKPNQAPQSPRLPQNRQKDSHGKGGGRAAPSAYDSEDEYPRRPEVEKLYEEFLHEEAIYVAEGTWDRFPQGSRLFVGEFYNKSTFS